MILLSTDYTFNAATKKITFLGSYATLEFQQIELITNVSNGNVIIYQFNKLIKGGTYAAPTLTLTYDTTAMNNSDTLMIIVSIVSGGGGGGAATIADGADVAEGSTTDAAVITNAVGTVSGKLRGLVALLASWIGTLGQKTSANSAPVVIASDQSAIPISGTITVTPSGTQDVNLTKVGGTAIAIGQQIAAASLPVILPSATITTLTPPAAITNYANETGGNLAAIKTDVDKIPSQGQAVMAASTPVVIASNQTPIPVSGTISTGGLTDAELRATPVPISGTVTANTGLTQPLTDTQLRATPVPVSGTVAVTGGATAANQATEIASLASIDGKIVAVNTGAVVVSSSALPTGASTAANQATGNTSLSSIDGKTPSLGQAAMAASIPVVIASNQSSVPVTIAAGSAVIGHVIVDSGTLTTVSTVTAVTTVSTVTAVTAITNALPAGSNLLGKTGIDQTTDGTTNKVRATGTSRPSYGATTALAVTALQSMTSSATIGWKSVRTSNLGASAASDYEVMISLTTANTAPANDKAMYLMVIPWYTNDAGATWFAASGGTTTLPTSADATYTIASPNNFISLGTLSYSTAQAVVQGVFFLSNVFTRMPDGFSFFVENFSGATLSTGCILDITPINDVIT